MCVWTLRRYTYMCYNASVHYWHVTRELQRPGVRAPLLPSMETVVKAVDGVPGQEEWKVQLRTNLALAYAEAGRPADAQKTAEEAYVMAKDKVPQLSSKVNARVPCCSAHGQLPGEAGFGATRG